MNAKKLPPSSSPTALAPASVFSRKRRSGRSGASTRLSIATKAMTSAAAAGGAAGADPAPNAERLVALGTLLEHVHDDRERGGQNDRRPESLDAAHRDQERVGRGQRACEGGGGEEPQAEHEDASAAEQ